MSLDELVDLEKLRDFSERVYQMARKEFGTDDEGKINKVQVHLVDRSRCWPMHFFPIPYDHKATTREERERILELLVANLQTAAHEVDTCLKIMRDERRLDEKKAAKAQGGKGGA